MKVRATLSALVLSLSALGLAANADAKSSSAAQQFEALKSLAGVWVAVDKDGKPTDTVVSSIRVTAGGNTVQETLFPGTEKEMVTMYHLDGADLVLTHYCMLGNQPRMKAESGGDASKIVFKFIGSSNLKSNDEHHMHEATIHIDGKDRYKAVWVSSKDGQTCHTATLDLVRKQK